MIILIFLTIIAEILIFCLGLYHFTWLNDKRESLFVFGRPTDFIDKAMDRIVFKTFWLMTLCLVTSIIIGILVV